MKRPIKFRAWDIENQKMMNFDDLMDIVTHEDLSFLDYILMDVKYKNDHFLGSDNYELMEYAGMDDVDGIPIFEDDILLVEDHYLGDIHAPRQLATVEFLEAEFYLENLEDEPKWLESSLSSHVLNKRCKIVGNKHESNINQLKKNYSIKS